MTFAITVLFSLVIILTAVLAMSVGVMAGREPIKGSCGGVSGGACELCSGRCRKRSEPQGE